MLARLRSRFLIPMVCGLLPFAASSASAAPAQPSGWPQFGQNQQHLNVSPDERAFTPQNVSRLRVASKDHFGDGSLSFGGPAAAGGAVYIGDVNGNLSAFAASGCSAASCEPLWQGRIGEGIYDTPAVSGGLVLIGSTDHFLYAFPAAGCGSAVCQPRWRGQLADAPLYSSPAVADGVAYIGDYGGRLYAFAVAGCGRTVCQPLWVGRAGANEELISSPAVGHGNVYIGSTINTPDDVTGRLLVFPAAGCGRQICQPSWTADVGGPVSTNLAAVVSGETVYIGSGTRFGGPNPSTHLYAFAAGGCGRSV
jgi:hypothetical protein